MSAELRRIATAIRNSRQPSRKLVARDLRMVLASMQPGDIKPIVQAFLQQHQGKRFGLQDLEDFINQHPGFEGKTVAYENGADKMGG